MDKSNTKILIACAAIGVLMLLLLALYYTSEGRTVDKPEEEQKIFVEKSMKEVSPKLVKQAYIELPEEYWIRAGSRQLSCIDRKGNLTIIGGHKDGAYQDVAIFNIDPEAESIIWHKNYPYSTEGKKISLKVNAIANDDEGIICVGNTMEVYDQGVIFKVDYEGNMLKQVGIVPGFKGIQSIEKIKDGEYLLVGTGSDYKIFTMIVDSDLSPVNEIKQTGISATFCGTIVAPDGGYVVVGNHVGNLMLVKINKDGQLEGKPQIFSGTKITGQYGNQFSLNSSGYRMENGDYLFFGFGSGWTKLIFGYNSELKQFELKSNDKYEGYIYMFGNIVNCYKSDDNTFFAIGPEDGTHKRYGKDAFDKDIRVLKFDTTGQLIWDTVFGGDYNEGSQVGIIFTSPKDYYIYTQAQNLEKQYKGYMYIAQIQTVKVAE